MDELKKVYRTYSPMYFEKYLNDPKTYGERVHAQRKVMNFTIRQLANKVGISYSQISKIETGSKTFISLNTLQALAEALSCSPLYLLGKTDSPNVPLENSCFTNPATNDELVKTWCSYTKEVRERKVCIDGNWTDNYDGGIRDTIELAKNNEHGIILQFDNRKYYLTYLKRKTYTNTSFFRKEQYVENKSFGGKTDNAIVIKLPNNPNPDEFLQHEELNDVLVIQDCSDVKHLIRAFDSRDMYLYYYQKLEEMFKEEYLKYKNCNLIDYLYELHNIDKLDENDIISKISYLIHNESFDFSEITKIFDNYTGLGEENRADFIKYLEIFTSEFTKYSSHDIKLFIRIIQLLMNKYGRLTTSHEKRQLRWAISDVLK